MGYERGAGAAPRWGGEGAAVAAAAGLSVLCSWR